MNKRFLLSKWYMDCISDRGDVFIGYAASLRWGVLSVHYSSTLVERDDRCESNTTLRRFSSPDVRGDCVSWESGRLGVRGTWTRTGPPIERTIYESEAGSVTWNCLCPGAAADVSVATQRFSGFGYLEHLTLTVPPWEMPIDELHWGRFIAVGESAIWIDWRGRHSSTLVFRNGEAALQGAVSEDRIDLDRAGTVLRLEEKHVLRSGPLAVTALSPLPKLRKLTPVRILHAHETKWRSRGVLQRSQQVDMTGWAIHEVVRWPHCSG